MDLLLLPGLLCDEASWAGVAAQLHDVAACRVARYGDERSLAAMAARALDGAPAQFALAGARVACEILRIAPERVACLALLDTGHTGVPAGVAGDSERERRRVLVESAHARGMRALAHAWLPPMIHPSRLQDENLVGEIVAMVERSTPQRFSAHVEALLARPAVGELLRAIRVPTLVACGNDDAWSPLAQHVAIASLVPGSRLATFADCGHMSPMERPAEVAAALRSLLCGPQGRSAGAASAAVVAGT
jgi:pimeloyl-ACP methyl ester carboxylesterase